MNILQSVQTALNGVGIPVGEGQYPDASETCGKIVFTGEEKPPVFMGYKSATVETFKIIVRGADYRTLENKADLIKSALKTAGFIPIGGYETVQPKEGETFMQLSVSFKIIN